MSTLLYILIACVPIDAGKILAVFPVPSISHQVVFRPLTQELARRGHEVVVITADPAFPEGKTPANLTEIDLHDPSYKIWRENFMNAEKTGKDGHLLQIEVILDAFTAIVEHNFHNKEIKDLMADKKDYFDLVFIESCIRPALGYSHVFKAPVILISSFGASRGNYEALGVPLHPFLYPYNLRQRFNNLTIMEKIQELYLLYSIDKIYERVEVDVNKMLKKHLGKDTPSVEELHKNVHMLFLNVNPVLDVIRPVPPSVVFMGGMHQNPVKELPTELKSYFDSCKNGVIYVSFGTNVDSTKLPTHKIEILVKVFSKLPYNVLWKWDGDNLPGRTENIRISKWLPQSDLLRHPNIKLFITQGGLQSTDEAITAGVPLIGVPMLADQWFNVENYVRHGIGVKLDMGTFTEEILRNSIDNVVGDQSYRRNVVRLRGLMRDQPQRPLERAVWWTEHVLRHGGAAHLRAPAANMSWADYLELELILVVLIVILSFVLLLITVLYFIYRYISKSVIGGGKVKQN